MTLTVRAPTVLEGTPAGARWIVEAESGRIDGDRIHAEITGRANADWFIVGPGHGMPLAAGEKPHPMASGSGPNEALKASLKEMR